MGGAALPLLSSDSTHSANHPSSTSVQITRLQIVEATLQQINIEGLRPLIRTESKWRRLCAGFRPDRISKRIIIARKLQIARQTTLIVDLLEALLKSLGIEHEDLRDGLKEASTDTRLTESTRRLYLELSATDLDDIPPGPSQIATQDPFNYSKPSTATHTDRDVTESLARRSGSPSSRESHATKTSHTNNYPHSGKANELSKESKPKSNPKPTFHWKPPTDQIKETQEVVTLFERSITAFVHWRLVHSYKDKWLTEGCAQFLQRWRTKAGNRALEPETLLGLCEIGEIKEIIVNRKNWTLFSPYFDNKQFVQTALDEVIALRVSGMHASQRELYLAEHISAVAAMVRIASNYHAETAALIDQVLQRSIGPDDSIIEGILDPLALAIETNLSHFQDPLLIGREQEMRQLNDFWNDRFQRVASIVGAGGVGKTALLDHIVNNRLRAETTPGSRPDPEVIIYLTAKDNYLEGVTPAPPQMRFNTLRQIYRVVIDTIEEEDASHFSMNELRRRVLTTANDLRIFFALDNLESLTGEDADEVSRFLDELPAPSKAIITTRDNRRMGTTIKLIGLPSRDARELLQRSLEESEIELTSDDLPMLDQVIEATGGVPLYLKHAANAVTQGGCTLEEAHRRLSGTPILEFLEFSYANCFERLADGAKRIAYFLALSPRPRRRNELERVCEDSGELDESIARLDQLAFIERVSNRRTIAFKLSNPQIAEYVKLQVPRDLPNNVVNLISNQVDTTTLSSPRNVEIAITKIIEQSYNACEESWSKGIGALERARSEWNDHPQILARLGYYYFRNHQRRTARQLIQSAIREGDGDSSSGYELPDTERPDSYAALALINLMDKHFDDAIDRARTATTLRPNFNWAEQILGQALYEKANRSRLMMSHDRTTGVLRDAKSWLVKSLYADDTTYARARHNERSHTYIGRVEALLASEKQYLNSRW